MKRENSISRPFGNLKAVFFRHSMGGVLRFLCKENAKKTQDSLEDWFLAAQDKQINNLNYKQIRVTDLLFCCSFYKKVTFRVWCRDFVMHYQ